jgi:hypothetical protein
MRSSVFWSFAKGKAATSPIEFAGRPGLAVVPYVRRRLAFAQIAAAALETGDFARLVVDLPGFLTRGELLELSHSAFPLAFSMIAKMEDGRHLVLPMVPNDAACIATFAARRNRVGYECVDAENFLFPSEAAFLSPDLTLPDDFFALAEGPDRYFAPLWSQMDVLWEEAPPVTRAYTAVRASLVAARLSEALVSGKRTLFVCEYRLWWAVRKALDGEWNHCSTPPSVPGKDIRIAFSEEDPHRLWAKGLLDDFPCVTLEFFDAVKRGKARSFDKLGTLAGVLEDLPRRDAPCFANGRSIRRNLAFSRYLKARAAASGRVVPLPSAHLLDAAEACFGQEYARELAKALLDYPVPESEGDDSAGTFYTLATDGTLHAGEAFEIPDDLDTADLYGQDSCPGPETAEVPGRERWADMARRTLTRPERKYFSGGCYGITWAVKDDYILHQGACALVRENIARDARRAVAKRSRGSMRDGIHWKATIRARSMGEKGFHVRKCRRDLRSLSIDEHTPHVFLFSEKIDGCSYSVIHDANLSQRRINFGIDPKPSGGNPRPDAVYSLLKAIATMESSLNGHIRREQNEALTFLYTRSHMGVERYEAITSKPKRHQCRQTPFEDPELSHFTIEEQFVAWAIKYAERFVIVVAHPGWGPSERLSRYARERCVKVISVPLSTLSPSLIRRLRTTYSISTALKKHPCRENILRRFVA